MGNVKRKGNCTFVSVTNDCCGNGISQFEMHRAGCRDLSKKHNLRPHWGSLNDALGQLIDPELVSLGYTAEEHVKVYPCCKGGK